MLVVVDPQGFLHYHGSTTNSLKGISHNFQFTLWYHNHSSLQNPASFPSFLIQTCFTPYSKKPGGTRYLYSVKTG
jgi:hypothetical protein